jgi:mono/diheme cytochrome c family protein
MAAPFLSALVKSVCAARCAGRRDCDSDRATEFARGGVKGVFRQANSLLLRRMEHAMMRIALATAGACAILSCTLPEPAAIAPPRPAAFDAATVARGARLAAVGNCVSCHTAPGGKPYAGGYALKTPFGTVHGTNITPDPQTGIGAWTLADFTRAMREGLDPRGRHYYPAFPYDYFTRLADEDVAALYAFVMTREPVAAKEPANAMLIPRAAVGIWKTKYFEPGRFRPDPAHDARWNRGAYLAEALAHCSACHTPRNALGAERRDRYMAGGEAGGWHAPALNRESPSPRAWTRRALTQYLSTGLVDEHAITAGPMAPVVRNLAHATGDDVEALATYVDSLMEGSRGSASSGGREPSREHARGAALYAGACGDCHDRGRDAEGGALHLPLAIALALPTPANLIHIVRDGIIPEEDGAQPWMPAYAGALTNEQTTELVEYLRTLSGKPPWPNVAAEVRRIGEESR